MTDLIEEHTTSIFGGGSKVFFARPQMVVEPGTFKGTEQELAQAIKAQVETYPETFDMGSYIDDRAGDAISTCVAGVNFEERLATLKAKANTACGTTLCIAGYAQLFVDGRIDQNVNYRAAELLGLDRDTRLFFYGDELAKVLLTDLADGCYEEGVIPPGFPESDQEFLPASRRATRTTTN